MPKKEFKSWIGRLLHIARVGRPDIMYQTIALARVADKPNASNVRDLTHLIKYLATTVDKVLRLDKPTQMHLVGYSDATWSPDYGTDYDNYRSTTGRLFQLGGGALLSWASRQQPIVARASTESELYAASDCALEAIHIRQLLNFMGHFTRNSVPIMVDNQSCIRQSVNTMDMRNARHYGRHAGWLRQRCKYGDVSLHYVPTKLQRADVLTKIQPRPGHEQSCAQFAFGLPDSLVHAQLEPYDGVPGCDDARLTAQQLIPVSDHGGLVHFTYV